MPSDGPPAHGDLLPRLLPHLVPLSTRGTATCPQHLAALRQVVFAKDVRAADLEALADHVTFPFEVYLDGPWLPENYTIDALDFVARFYSRVPLCRSRVLLGTVDRLMRLCFAEDGTDEKSEDLRAAVCRCLSSLFSSSTEQTLLELYSNHEENKLRFSQLVLAVLGWLERDIDVNSSSSACLDLLQSLCPKSLRNVETPEKSLLAGFCLVFHQMLPGISSKLMKLLKDGKVKIRVKSQLLSTWTDFVSLILNDMITCDNVEDLGLDSCEDGDVAPTDHSSLKFDPGKDWLNLAKDHICNQGQVLTGISASLIVDDIGVSDAALNRLRRQLLTTARVLSRRCFQTLDGMISTELDVLSHLSTAGDGGEGASSSSIASEARKAISAIVRSLPPDARSTTAGRAQSAAFDLATTLSKLGGGAGDVSVGSAMGRLEAAIALIENVEESSVFFLSETYLKTLVKALMRVSRLKSSGLSFAAGVRTECDANLAEVLFHPVSVDSRLRPEKPFEYLTTPGLIRRKQRLLRAVINCAGSSSLVDYVIDILKTSGDDSWTVMRAYRREAVVVLHDIVEGFSSRSNAYGEDARMHALKVATSTISQTLIDLLEDDGRANEKALVPATQNLRLDNSRDRNLFEEWTIQSVCVESFGKLAIISQRLKWTDYKLLYLPVCLPACLLSTNLASQHQTDILSNALQDIAEGCGYGTVSNLLSSHLDLLSRELVLSLRRLSRAPAAAIDGGGLRTLLRVVLRTAKEARDGPGSLETELGLGDVMDAVLTQLDLSWLGPDPRTTTELLDIVLVFVQALHDDDDEAVEEERKPGEKEESATKVGSVTQFILDLKAADAALESSEDEDFQPCPEEGFHTSNADDNDDDVGDEEEDVKRELPPEMRRLREAIEHTRHFVSMSRQPRWQVAAMDVVARCAAQLKMEREELLPLIHLCWQPLKLLFDSDNLFVLEKAFGVVLVFARCAGDFVAARTVKDVLPAMLKSTRKLQVVLSKPDRRHTLVYHQSQRLLDQVVSALSEIPALLDLEEQEVDDILEELIAYEEFVREKSGDDSKGQERSLLKLFSPRRPMDADALWLKTNYRSIVKKGKT